MRGLLNRMRAYDRVRNWFPRSIEQVCRDIDDELQHHIDEGIRARIEQGTGLAHAYEETHKQIGDINKLRAQLIIMGLRPQFRIAASLLVAMGLVAVGAGAAAIGLYSQLSSTNNTIASIQTHLEVQRAKEHAAVTRTALAPAQPIKAIQMMGAIDRPRLWTLDGRNEVTLAQLLFKSGGLTDDADGRVFVIYEDASSVFEVPISDGVFDLTRMDRHYLSRSCTVFVVPQSWRLGLSLFRA